MTKDNLKRANRDEYTVAVSYDSYREWGNAKGKHKVKKQISRFGRRKLNQKVRNYHGEE